MGVSRQQTQKHTRLIVILKTQNLKGYEGNTKRERPIRLQKCKIVFFNAEHVLFIDYNV